MPGTVGLCNGTLAHDIPLASVHICRHFHGVSACRHSVSLSGVPLLRWLGFLTWCLTLANTACVAFVRCVDTGWEGPTGVT